MIVARRLSLALILTLYQAFVALAVAWPIEAFVRASYGQNLDGDATLWRARDGGLALLDLVAHGRAAWSPLVAGMLVALCAGGVLGVVPIALVIRSLGDLDRGTWKPLRARVARSVESWLTLLLLWFAYAGAAVAIALGARFLAHFVNAIASGSGEVRSQQLGWSAGALFLLLFLPLNVLHDLAQISAVLEGRGFFGSIARAARSFRRRAASLIVSWSWRAIAGAIFVAGGSAVASRLGGFGGGALVTLFVVHQLVVLLRAWLRVDWLESAATSPSSVDTAARTDAPGVPSLDPNA